MQPDCLIVADLAETHRLDHALVERRIEAVVHFAAFTYVGESVKDPGKYYRNNLSNTLGLMECLRCHHIGKFVFSSTAATYGTPTQVPIPEDEAKQPINPYGAGKLAVERRWRTMPLPMAGVALPCYFNASGAI